MARSRAAFAVAREITATPADLAIALFWSASLNILLRDWKTAYPQADEATRLADQHRLMSLMAYNGFLRAITLAQLGQIEEGLSETLRWRAEFINAGTVLPA